MILLYSGECLSYLTSTLFIAFVFGLLVACTVNASGQQANLLLSREQIYNVATEHVSCSPSKTGGLLLGSEYGLLNTYDTCNTIQYTISPVAFSRVEAFKGSTFNDSGHVIVVGTDKAKHTEGLLIRSTNGGFTWSDVDLEARDSLTLGAGIVNSNLIDLRSDNWGLLFDRVSSNAGHSWFTAPLPSGVQLNDYSNVDYLGLGRFQFRISRLKKRYEIDASCKCWIESDVPYEVIRVMRTKSGVDVGYRLRDKFHRFMIRDTSNSTFIELDSISVNGVRIDSLRLSAFYPTPDGRMIATSDFTVNASVSPPVIVAFDGVKWNAWNVWDYDSSITRLSRVIDFDGDVALISCANDSLNIFLLLMIDIRTGVMQIHDVGNKNFNANVLIGKYIIDCGLAGRLVRYDTERRRMYRVGTLLADEHNRQHPLGFLENLSNKANTWCADPFGDIYLLRDDASLELRATQTGFQEYHPEFTSHAIVDQLPNGSTLLWTWDSSAVVGGSTLTQIQNSGIRNEVTLRTDTTTAFAVSSLSSTRLYAAYKNVFISNNNGQSWIELGKIDSSFGAIGSIVERSSDTLLIGARGFVQDKTGVFADTTEFMGGIWKTDDGATTWHQVTLPVSTPYIICLQERNSDRSMWCVSTTIEQRLVTDTLPSGTPVLTDGGSTQDDIYLLRSNDGGDTWMVVQRQQFNGTYQPTTGCVSFAGNRTVVWTTHDRVHWSDDDGATWRDVSGLPSYPHVISSARFDNKGDLLIATGDGIYKVPADPVSVEDDGAVLPNDKTDDPKLTSTPIFWANSYPNPSGNSLTVKVYNTDKIRGEVKNLEIIDIHGRVVFDLKPLIAGNRSAGIKEFNVTLSNTAPGIYLLVGADQHRSFCWQMVVK